MAVPRPKGTKPEVWAFMVDAYTVGGCRTVADMTTAFHRAARTGDILKSDIPAEYTLRRRLKDLQAFFAGEPASLRDFPIEHSEYLLEVLMSVVDFTEGRVSNFTREEVDWIVRVHAAAPLVPSHSVYRFAQAYIARERTGESSTSLDISLASYANWDVFSRLHDQDLLPAGQYPVFAQGVSASELAMRLRDRRERAAANHLESQPNPEGEP